MFPETVDLYNSDIPRDLITNENGEVIGEVYVPLPDPPQRRKKHWNQKNGLKNTED